MSQKLAIVDAWAESENIDIFSPQLYTSGVEEEPEFAITQCGNTLEKERTCTYERLKKMKAKWVPSLSWASHYPAAKKFFAEKGITVRRARGRTVWAVGHSRACTPPRAEQPPAPAPAGQTHGFIEWGVTKDGNDGDA